MTETYYRLHRDDAPTFTADNAWSGLWGGTFSPDGARSECPQCDESGEYDGEECSHCAGEGWLDCDYGYSCCYTAAELVAYFSRGGGLDAVDLAQPVVVFAGEQVGNGFDGEPLVVPTEVVRWTTLGELAR
jgi:hypothetical protein